jgi:uncharacterized protein involved in type VI secretion and phage assembly
VAVAVRLYDSAGAQEEENGGGLETRILTGTVVNNCDLIGQGKVLVRVHSSGEEIWCRLTTIGGGNEAGILYVPRIKDEVVVGQCGADAFVMGGLYSSQNAPPVNSAEAPTKRVIKTGVVAGQGHEVEFDDVLQSIKIETSTKQKITLDPKQIEVKNAAGTLSITLDEKTQTVTIKGVNITLEAAAKLTLKGRVTVIKADPGPLTLGATAACSVKGTPIRLNCTGP